MRAFCGILLLSSEGVGSITIGIEEEEREEEAREEGEEREEEG